ncbi:MAG: ATP-dependent DNA helicase RecG, partial [Oscillospiraceae bacterium]
KAVVSDGLSEMIITIFNSRYQFDQLLVGNEYYFYGKVTGNLSRIEMTSPNFFDTRSQNLIWPIYNLTEGLSNKVVQTQMEEALLNWSDCLVDCLPVEIRKEYHLCQIQYAMKNIHFPTDREALDVAKQRLVFEELLIFQLGILSLKEETKAKSGATLKNIDISEFINSLPFELTVGQKNAIDDCLCDMQNNIPMNRLCQGDVGSGKTMVAAAVAFACYKNNLQSAIMVPTQILAVQHYETFLKILSPLGVKICLITGNTKVSAKKEILEAVKNGEYDIVIGTHAISQESVEFKNLSFVVTDEQHRFGVSQRAKLASKGEFPHLLVMSATPIPRTLALIVYGDLEISAIKELPNGRKPIETYTISSKKRERALNFVKKQLDEGRQVYIVCPLIDDNESELLSITKYMEMLEKTPLSDYKIGALNGRMKGLEKEEIMQKFKDNEIQILVTTTVVEVGVDVPNANVMLIENAERFGLSQLHQLRGRVGRGEFQSYCILASDNKTEATAKRLKVMHDTNDGFVIAEEDMKLRGVGDFFGQRQHGLPDLKIANLFDDIDILKQTQKVARELIKKPLEKNLKEAVERLFEQNGGINHSLN